MIVVAAVVLVFVPLPLPVVASFAEALGFVVSRCLFATGFLLSHQYHDGFVCIPMISYVYNIQYIDIPIYSWLILYGSIWLYLVAMFFKATPILRPGSSSERLPALRWQVWSFIGSLEGSSSSKHAQDFKQKRRVHISQEEAAAVREALEIDTELDSGTEHLMSCLKKCKD